MIFVEAVTLEKTYTEISIPTIRGGRQKLT